jgi:purine-binding chemotaxis protein CheW
VTRVVDILWFELGGGRFGLRLDDVQEVVRAVAIAPLPAAPSIVEGVIDIRGRIVPVLDVRTRFQLPSKRLELTDVFIIARLKNRTVALRVDRTGWPTAVREADIVADQSALAGSQLTLGVARTSDGLVILHDLDAFLTSAEDADLAAALAQSHSTSEVA